MSFKKHIYLIVFVFLTSALLTNCYAQAKFDAGMNFLFDKSSKSNFRFITGISFDAKFKKHLGISLEISYRTYIDNSFVETISLPPNNSGIVHFTMKQKFFTIPLMLKYYFKNFSLSAGPSADFYQGIHEEKYNTDPPGLFIPTQTSYKFDKLVLWGLKVKVSKDFQLLHNIGVEPTLFYNPIFTLYSLYSDHYITKRQYYGGSIVIKYLF